MENQGNPNNFDHNQVNQKQAQQNLVNNNVANDPQGQNVYQKAPQKTCGMAVASLVLGIISLVFSYYAIAIYTGIIAIVLGIVAIVLGVLGRKKIQESQGQLSGKGMATAGLIMGIIGIAVSVVILIACAACVGSIINELDNLQ